MLLRSRKDESDAELMRRVQGDDIDAFDELYNRHSKRAYSVAVAVCRDRRRAEDALQEGFLSIWRARASYRPAGGAVGGWVISVVRHRAIDSNRYETSSKKPTLEKMPENSIDAERSVEEEVITRDENRSLRTALEKIPAPQAKVIELAFFGGLSHSEIAERLEMPSGTVKGRIRLGLIKLREQLATPAG